MDNRQIPRHGEIWYCDFNSIYTEKVEHNQKGIRPVYIASNSKHACFSPTINVIPITSKTKNSPVHINIEGCGLNRPSQILVEDITSIDKIFLTTRMGECTEDIKKEVGKALSKQHESYLQILTDKLTMMDNFFNKYNVIPDREDIKERELIICEMESYCRQMGLDLHKYVVCTKIA
jgi:mRNA-degrading endonuclease toxin of MazEF toxin-antitoxin module